jgi:hypothetical protein
VREQMLVCRPGNSGNSDDHALVGAQIAASRHAFAGANACSCSAAMSREKKPDCEVGLMATG